MKIPTPKIRLHTRAGSLTTTRTIRGRVRAGRIEPLEAIKLREGQEVRVVVELGGTEPQTGPAKVKFATWNLGTVQPFRRAGIYEDVG